MISWTELRPDSAIFMTRNFTYGRGGQRVQYIVVHHNAGALSARQIWNLWQTRLTASAHYQVDRAGHISQHVQLWDTAWHATNELANQRSIGIEHANGSGVTGPLTEATLDNGAHLVAALCVAYGLGRPAWGRNVFGHAYFVPTACPGPIGGVQHAAYMSRAQGYYDQMTGRTPVTDLSKGQNMTVTPLTYEQTKNAAAEGAASVGYGAAPDRITWGQMATPIYNAARYGAPPVVEALARLEASQAAQDAAITALAQAVTDLAAAVAGDDDEPVVIDTDAIVAAIREAGEQAAVGAVEAVRESLPKGGTFTLGVAADDPSDPEPPAGEPDPEQPSA